MYTIRPIQAADDAKIAAIIRSNLEAYRLDVPGTAYFDPELDHLSRYYAGDPARRAYFILEDGAVLGGVGVAEFSGLEDCAELQKLYLADGLKGRGLGRQLLETAEDAARTLGYRRLYLETHSALVPALRLYEAAGFTQISQPETVLHTTMDRFYLKEL